MGGIFNSLLGSLPFIIALGAVLILIVLGLVIRLVKLNGKGISRNAKKGYGFFEILGKTGEQKRIIKYFKSTGILGAIFRISNDTFDNVLNNRVHELGSEIEKRSLEAHGMDSEEVQEIPPIHVENYYDESRYQKVFRDFSLRASEYQMSCLMFSEKQMYAYSHIFDLTSEETTEQTKEYFYEDITNVDVTKKEIELINPRPIGYVIGGLAAILSGIILLISRFNFFEFIFANFNFFRILGLCSVTAGLIMVAVNVIKQKIELPGSLKGHTIGVMAAVILGTVVLLISSPFYGVIRILGLCFIAVGLALACVNVITQQIKSPDSRNGYLIGIILAVILSIAISFIGSPFNAVVSYFSLCSIATGLIVAVLFVAAQQVKSPNSRKGYYVMIPIIVGIVVLLIAIITSASLFIHTAGFCAIAVGLILAVASVIKAQIEVPNSGRGWAIGVIAPIILGILVLLMVSLNSSSGSIAVFLGFCSITAGVILTAVSVGKKEIKLQNIRADYIFGCIALILFGFFVLLIIHFSFFVIWYWQIVLFSFCSIVAGVILIFFAGYSRHVAEHLILKLTVPGDEFVCAMSPENIAAIQGMKAKIREKKK